MQVYSLDHEQDAIIFCATKHLLLFPHLHPTHIYIFTPKKIIKIPQNSKKNHEKKQRTKRKKKSNWTNLAGRRWKWAQSSSSKQGFTDSGLFNSFNLLKTSLYTSSFWRCCLEFCAAVADAVDVVSAAVAALLLLQLLSLSSITISLFLSPPISHTKIKKFSLSSLLSFISSSKP